MILDHEVLAINNEKLVLKKALFVIGLILLSIVLKLAGLLLGSYFSFDLIPIVEILFLLLFLGAIILSIRNLIQLIRLNPIHKAIKYYTAVLLNSIALLLAFYPFIMLFI